MVNRWSAPGFWIESFGAEDRSEILEALDMVVWRRVAGGYVNGGRRSAVFESERGMERMSYCAPCSAATQCTGHRQRPLAPRTCRHRCLGHVHRRPERLEAAEGRMRRPRGQQDSLDRVQLCKTTQPNSLRVTSECDWFY